MTPHRPVPVWPLTGREEELRIALDVLLGEDGRGLVLRGHAGVGKTRLAAELVAAVGEAEVVERVVATSPTIPFAPFAHLLDPDDPPGAAPGRLEPPDLLWALRQIRTALLAPGSGSPRLVVVDDAHRLDEASAGLLRQMAEAGEIQLLATVRAGEPCPEPVAILWRERTCALLELQPLARHEIGELTAAVLGCWLEQASLDHLMAASAGNPLVVRELLAEAEAEDGLTEHRGLLRWRGPQGSTRLDALVTADLDRLDEDALAFVDLLATAGSLPLVIARRLASLDVLAGLERAGVISLDELGDGQVRFGHPLFGEVRRAALGALQVRTLSRRLAAAAEVDGAPGGGGDGLRVVCWRLDADEAVPAPEVLAAGLEAWRRGDAVLAERLVRTVLRAGPDPTAELLLAELAELAGRAEEAAALLDGLGQRLVEDGARARCLATRIRVLAHVLGRADDAARVAAEASDLEDPAWRGFVQAQWATTLAMLGRIEEATALGEELFAHADERVRLRALPAVNLGRYARGRVDDAVAAAESMVGPALTHREDVPVGISVVFSSLAVDLLILGRFDDLDQLLALAVDPVASLPSSRAYLLLVGGSLALERGQADEARRLLAESLGLFGQADPQGYRAASAALLAEACAAVDDRAGALAAAAEAEVGMAGRPARLIDGDSRRACAWAAVSDGDPTEARRRLLDAAAAARQAGLPTLEMRALHDAVRVGGGRTAQRRLRTVAAQVDGARAAAMRSHAAAALADDPVALEATAEQFAAFGALLVAAEVAASASQRFAIDGRREAATRTARRSRALLARCPGAVLRTALGGAGPALTPREDQIARLAAAGWTSKDIADELTVSVRTVDNHLSRAYTKLGIAGRSELAAALADVPA